MELVIRPMVENDSIGIARVMRLGWQQNYRGLVNDEFLNNLDTNEEQRILNIRNNFNSTNCVVLLNAEEIVGFVRFEKSDYESYLDAGEVCALYILNDYKGLGYGKKLFLSAIENLKTQGYKDFIVGCFKGNRANDFYLHIGCEKIGERIIVRGNQELEENVYYYKK